MRKMLLFVAGVAAASAVGAALANQKLRVPQTYSYHYIYEQPGTGAAIGHRVYQCNGLMLEWGVLEGNYVLFLKKPCP